MKSILENREIAVLISKNCLRILFLLLLCYSCTKKNDGNNKRLDRLIVGFVPSEEAERMIRSLQPVTDFLQKELKMPVKIYRGSDYSAIIEGMRAGKVDVGIFGPFSYVLASKNAGAEPLVIPSKRNGDPASYNSLILTHVNTGINSIEDLKRQKGRFTLSFSDPASTSGHLVPRGKLHTFGIQPEDHFTDILFSGSHTATILALSTQKVDVIGCSFTVFNKMLERGMINETQVKLLWKSNPLPVDLVTVRENLPESFKKELKDIYVRLADEAPESAAYFYDEWNDSSLVYLPVRDSVFSEIRELAKYIGAIE